MALLIYILYASGGGESAFGLLSTKYMKAQTKAAIADAERRDRALHALSRMTDEIDDLNEGRSKDLEAFRKIVHDHRSRPEDFDRLFERASAEDLRRVEGIWARRATFLGEVRPEEWEAIVRGAKAEAAKDAEKAKKK